MDKFCRQVPRLGLVLALGLNSLFSAEPDTNRVIRASSFQATNALASFQLEPGFRIELVAAEPLVESPAAIAFDEAGRMFVAEMRRGLDPGSKRQNGRVRLLQDPDEQGQFRTGTLLADDLVSPSGLICYAGGVFVTSGSDILYLKDGSGEGSADLRTVVLTGFEQTNEVSSSALLNNLNWGLNGRIYAASAGLGGSITSTNYPGSPIPIEAGDFSFNPRTLALVPESGPGYSGLTFDNFQRRYVSDFPRPLRLVVYERRYWARNPFFAPAPELADAANPGTLAFRRVSDASTNAPLTNLWTAGWLTNSQGTVIYRGNAFPTNYWENAFVCNPSAHAVQRFILSENGLLTIASRPANEKNSEFLGSKDSSFTPVQAVNGPGGALYIVDAQEAERQGRIYRIVPRNFTASKPVNLKPARTFDLVAALAHPNGWQRDTAARLLFERQDPAAAPLLSSMLSNSVSIVARLNAAYTLGLMGALKPDHLLKLLQDGNVGLRQNAVLLCEFLMPNGSVPAPLLTRFQALANDPSPRVRLQLAFTLGAMQRPEKLGLLAQILSRDPGNEWVQTAVLSSLGDGSGAMFRLLANDNRFRNDPAGMLFLQRLGDMLGARGSLDEVTQATDFLGRAPLQPLEAFRLTGAVGEGLRRTRSSLGLVDPNGTLGNIYASALSLAVDVTVPELARIEAVRMLTVSPYSFSDVSDWLLLMCNPHPGTALRASAIEALGKYDDPRIIPAFLDRWPGMPILLRRQAVLSMLARNSRVQFVLAALEQGKLTKADLPSVAMNFLRAHPDSTLAERAKRVLGPVPLRRPDLIDQYKPALHLRGAVDHGRDLFNARCAGCHQIAGTARLLGPDLAGARVQGKESLLSSIVEPNAHISPGYETFALESQEGELAIGRKTAEGAQTVALMKAGAAPSVWPKLNVRALMKENWSLMPDGLEQGLSTQDMADLLEFLSNGK